MKTRGLNCKSFGGCRNESELLKLKFFGSYTHILNKCSCVNYKYLFGGCKHTQFLWVKDITWYRLLFKRYLARKIVAIYTLYERTGGHFLCWEFSFFVWLFVWGYGHWAMRVLSLPHLLWHGASVYNGHLRGTMTLTTIAERLAVEMSLPVFTT